MTYPVEIRTQRLMIREFSANDTEDLFLVTSDLEVVRYLEFGPTSMPEAQGLVDFAMRSAKYVQRLSYVLGIVDESTGSLVGSCGLQASDDDPAAAELYVVFRRDQWGKGLAGEIVPALIDLAWGSTGFARVTAMIHPDNGASIRVMELAGMVSDGIIDDAFPDPTDPEGRWREGLRYAILRP